MNSLGVYFGPKTISIVEAKGKNLLNAIQVPQNIVATSELEEKVPSEVKIVAIFKEELRKNKIDSNEASLALSGKDLVIRTFEMPVIPVNELFENAVAFEVRKYIPFKAEDLVSDFQVQFDKLSRKNIILFVGIRKENLAKYLSIFNQLDIRLKAIEYSAFSILGFLKSAGINYSKGVTGIIGADPEDEVNFAFLENGFPLFSRDTMLGGAPEELANDRNKDTGMILEKLKTEIRVSLDYYHRKFPAKKIEKIFCIAPQEYRVNLEPFIVKEMGIPIQFVDTVKAAGDAPFSLGKIKGYSSALSGLAKTGLKIDLLAVKGKIKAEEGSAAPNSSEILSFLLRGLKVDTRAIIAAILICIIAFSAGKLRSLPLTKELNQIKGVQPQVSNINQNASYEELVGISSQYNDKLSVLTKLLRNQLRLTKVIETVARANPGSIWLKSFNFKQESGSPELTLDGMAYLPDSVGEFELVNKFLAALKESAVFAKYFGDISIASLGHAPFKKATVTTFIISCRSRKER